MSLIKTLIYCLDVLRIERDTRIYQTTMELAQKEVPIESVNNDNVSSNQEWITAMRIIANVYCSSLKNDDNTDIIFSQSQLSDFLTLSARGIGERERGEAEKRMKTKSDIIFKMYRDIIENYQNFSQRLKSNYPSIIVDVISIIINRSIDTKGTKVSSTSIEEYYQLRKQQETTMANEEEKISAMATTTTTPTTTTALMHRILFLFLLK
jgi:hypothetical protein